MGAVTGGVPADVGEGVAVGVVTATAEAPGVTGDELLVGEGVATAVGDGVAVVVGEAVAVGDGVAVGEVGSTTGDATTGLAMTAGPGAGPGAGAGAPAGH